MTLHITIEDEDEPVAIPNCHDMLILSDAMRDLQTALRAKAQDDGTAGMWGAAGAIETACYYIHGAAGYLARDEGLIG